MEQNFRYPSLGLGGGPTDADKKLSQELLRSFGVPNIAGLDKGRQLIFTDFCSNISMNII